MQIDAHQHFWVYNQSEYGWIDDAMTSIRRDFLPGELQPLAESEGFQGSVLVQVRQSVAETRWLLELAEDHPFILGVVGWVELRSPGLRQELESLAKKAKLVGIRHIVQNEHDNFLLEPDFLRGISMLEEFGLAYDVLIYSKHLPVAAKFIERFPQQRFVLDHLGKPPIKSRAIDDWARGIGELSRFPNVCAKLSGLVTEADWQAWTPDEVRPYFDVAFECFGPSRLMFGSDWPVCTLAASYGRTVKLVENYLRMYSPEERAAVLGGNAAKFWRLRTR